MQAPGGQAAQPAPGQSDPGAERSGIIFDIKRFAIHDGPGIRTTVFLKGCPLHCPWCHNPEGIGPEPEPWVRPRLCTGCGRCVEACPSGAISLLDGLAVTDRQRCRLCGRCVEVCPSGAREMVGRRASVEDVLAVVERDRVFYEQSGGGVTFSGGEPLAQPGFLGTLLAACRERDIHTAVDTTCMAPWETIESILPAADLLLCDIKHMDDAAHRRATGAGNGLILDNIRRIANAGARMIIRVPVIPGFNDDEQNIAAVGRFVSSLKGVRRVDVLPYNEGGRRKRLRLGRGGEPAAPFEAQRPSAEHLAAVASMLAGMGLSVKEGG
ncbi:MAG: glycyl-radical enzyme activating protein [Planctomycetes bacterium]|nr:glycyl-radical enzyme activating protein [Planctomycetota bacterium]